MSAVKTLDVKGLEHGEREQLIFPGIESLKEGETIRLLMEFNPLPLVYMLDARKEFDTEYEKQGPEEWILRIRRTVPGLDNKAQLKQLLKSLRAGEVSDAIKEQAKEIFQAFDAKTLSLLEQELIQEGVSRDEIRRSLCDIHLEVLKDSLVARRIQLSAPHPAHTLMEEHKVILSSLKDLGNFLWKLEAADGFDGLSSSLEELKDTAHHLVEAESHHQREEEALFPRLEKHGITEPPAIMKEDHLEFRRRKKRLFQIAQNPQSNPFSEFRREVLNLGTYITRELESHIFKEDNILYQIALQILSSEEWDEVKRECDKIGYCCFTPEDQVTTKHHH